MKTAFENRCTVIYYVL